MSHYLHIRNNINPTFVFLACIHLWGVASVITFERERGNVNGAPWAVALLTKLKMKRCGRERGQ